MRGDGFWDPKGPDPEIEERMAEVLYYLGCFAYGLLLAFLAVGILLEVVRAILSLFGR